jgi:hypothetical protein
MVASAPELSEYLARPMTPPEPEVAAVLAGPADAGLALPLEEIDRLRDPAPLPLETGWCRLPDGVAFVAVRTGMPAVSGEMVDWWFDWHPRDPVRYQAWFPGAHESNSIEPPPAEGAKPHWGAVHHPVEDIGVGLTRARISFERPTELGFATDALDDPAVATIVCGWVGDESRRVQVGVMAHVFLNEGSGVVLRSHFWLGAAIRPYAPEPIATLAGTALNNRLVRRLVLPRELPSALAAHCAAEYANFTTLVPELFERFGAANERPRVNQV